MGGRQGLPGAALLLQLSSPVKHQVTALNSPKQTKLAAATPEASLKSEQTFPSPFNGCSHRSLDRRQLPPPEAPGGQDFCPSLTHTGHTVGSLPHDQAGQ